MVINQLKSENVAARLKQATWASKSGIANFVKKTYFNNKLKNITSNKNELKDLSKKLKQYKQKGLRKDLINEFSIFNGEKYLS